MKLFKSLLVAPATLGLLAPMAATANEVTISDFAPAEQLAITNSRVDGLEARMNNIEAGSFSETTSASFSADFAIGAVDGDTNERVTTAYGFQVDLSTSFTGEDSFNVSLDAGSLDAETTLDELDLNDVGNALTVDGITYTFPLGEKTTVLVGGDVDGSSLYNTACVYGGVTDTLDDCGNGNSAMNRGAGTVAGASFDIGNGFTAALGYTGDGDKGLMTAQGSDVYGAQLSYVADSYGASVTYADVEGTNDTTYWGLNGYWTPSETGTAVPSVSVGYEMGDPTTGNDTEQWFVGLQWDEMGPGVLGAALGTNGAIVDGSDELLMYEAFYSYAVNDSMTITPLVYISEQAGDDATGFMVKTSFSF